MQTQSETPTTRRSTRTPQKSASQNSESKSVGDVISANLDKDAQKQLDEVLDQASQYMKNVRSYVSENRGEALALAFAAGVVGWALLYTRPGRQIIEMAAPTVIPQVQNLLSETFAAQAKA